MKAATIVNIVLLSILAVMQLFAYLTCIIWRIKKYHKGLNKFLGGICFLFLSIFAGTFAPIIGLIYPGDGGYDSLYKSLTLYLLLTIISLIPTIRWICYCIYLDGNYVVERTLFSETKIDLTDSATKIDDSMPHTKDFWTTIYSSNGQIIQFIASSIDGDPNQFIKDCCEIQNKKNIS